MLGIDQVHPPGQFLPPVMVSEVQVADHHHLVCLAQRFRGGQLQGHPHLIIIMNMSTDKEDQHQDEDGQRAFPTLMQEPGRQEMNQPRQVEHEEDHQEVEHDNDRGGADVVEQGGPVEPHPVESASHERKHAHDTGRHQHRGQPFAPFREGQDAPHVPQHIAHGTQDDNEDDPEHRAHLEQGKGEDIDHRCGDGHQRGVEAVEHAPVTGKDVAAVLDAQRALEQ